MINKDLMLRPAIRTTVFDWMGEDFAPYLGNQHFLGRSPFDIPYRRSAAEPSRREPVFVLKVPVPRFAKEEISITVMDDVLVVRGVRQHHREHDHPYLLEQCHCDSFERRFTLRKGVGHERILASYADGMITITFEDVAPHQEREIQAVPIR